MLLAASLGTQESLGKAATFSFAKGVVKLSARVMRIEMPLERGSSDGEDGVGFPQQRSSPQGTCFGHRGPSGSQWPVLDVLQKTLGRESSSTCRAIW